MIRTAVIAACFALASPAYATTDFLAVGHVEGEWFNAAFTGTTPDGLTFKIERDGTAEVRGNSTQPDVWQIGCKVDAMTDMRSCAMNWWIAGSVQFQFDSNNRPATVCVTNNVLLIGQPLIRVGTGKPIQGKPNGCFSPGATAAILAKMKPGEDFKTRTMHLGEMGIVDIELQVNDAFTVAKDMLDFLYARKDRAISWPAQSH